MFYLHYCILCVGCRRFTRLMLNFRFYFTNPRDMDYKSYMGGCMNTCVHASRIFNSCCLVGWAMLFVVCSILSLTTSCCSYMGSFVSSWVRTCCRLRLLSCSTCVRGISKIVLHSRGSHAQQHLFCACPRVVHAALMTHNFALCN